MAQAKSTTNQSGGGASETLGKAAEASRADYHAQGEASTKGRAGRRDPEVGKPTDQANVNQD